MAHRRLRLARPLSFTAVLSLAASFAWAADTPPSQDVTPAAAPDAVSCTAAATPEVVWLAIDLSCGACSQPACIGKKAGDSCGFSGQKCGASLPRCTQDNKFRCFCDTP